MKGSHVFKAVGHMLFLDVEDSHMSSQQQVDCQPPTVGVAKHAVSSLIDGIRCLDLNKTFRSTSGCLRAATSEGFRCSELRNQELINIKIRDIRFWPRPALREKFCVRSVKMMLELYAACCCAVHADVPCSPPDLFLQFQLVAVGPDKHR